MGFTLNTHTIAASPGARSVANGLTTLRLPMLALNG
jgi:hypothetical protein